MIYYSKKDIIVRDSIPKDVIYLRYRLRQSDVDEIRASHGKTPLEGLLGGLKKSALCLTVEKDKKAIAMFGCVPESLLSDRASVWLLASDKLTEIQFQFLRYSKRFIQMMLANYNELYNWVSVKNKTTKKWLKFCGATFGSTMPYGVEKQLFTHFYFKAEV